VGRAAARGYVITSSPEFLEQYRAVDARLAPTLSELERQAAAVAPELQTPTAELVDLVERWRAEVGELQIALVQQGRPEAAADLVASGASQSIYDVFRSRSDGIREVVERTRADLEAQLAALRSVQVGLTSGLSILGLFAAALVVVGFAQTLRLLDELEAARRRSEELANETHTLYEAAQTERLRLRAVFDHSPEGFLVADASGAVVLTNSAAQRLLGPLDPGATLDPHPLSGRAFLADGRPCPPDDLPLLMTLRDGGDRRGELLIAQPDGLRVPVLVTSVALRDDGVVQGGLVVVQDLRKLREVERLKADFVALVSHELRTPLTTIKGASQAILRRGPVDLERVRELVQIVDEQGDRLQELIDNLLSLSQLEAGALRLRRETVDLADLIDRVLRQQREHGPGLRLVAEIAPGLPPVSADPRRIEQVLTNLLDNARKYASAGDAITISARPDGPLVLVGVRDGGPGIAPPDRERVFDRFYQAAPNATSAGGAGLGLAICKSLVESHGGTIWADAAPGGGALIQFTLPALEEEPASAPADRGGAQLLVVDDDAALRRVVARSLEDSGYRVVAVGDGEAALDALTRTSPDLVLLDVMLPGVDGFALLRQMREWTSAPIIMLTARASEQDIVRGLQRGADDYVTKPFRLGELLARIEALLRRAQISVALGEPTLIENGGLAIDLAQRRVTLGGAEVTLTPTEYRILLHLARNVGQVLSHEQILKAVWGDSYGAENHYLWVHVAHLRQKVEPDPRRPRLIVTERGVGYRMPRL
jgi:two-component system KDP operon response regulator KdpE